MCVELRIYYLVKMNSYRSIIISNSNVLINKNNETSFRNLQINQFKTKHQINALNSQRAKPIENMKQSRWNKVEKKNFILKSKVNQNHVLYRYKHEKSLHYSARLKSIIKFNEPATLIKLRIRSDYNKIIDRY